MVGGNAGNQGVIEGNARNGGCECRKHGEWGWECGESG